MMFGIGTRDVPTLAVHGELQIERLDNQERGVVTFGHLCDLEAALPGVHQALQLLPHISRSLRIVEHTVERLVDLHWDRIATQMDRARIAGLDA